MKIRFAEYKDLEDIISIYNQAIKAGNTTADIKGLNINDREN